MLRKESITDYFTRLQDDICAAVEQADGKAHFAEDTWQRDGGGGGRSRVMTQGNIIEKGGVNFSGVYGNLSDTMVKHLGIQGSGFYATGVSIVMHPQSPMVPIIHMNVRYFEAGDTYWFGGGIDLTPHYVVDEDARYFHQSLKAICDQSDPGYYPAFKKWADDYFFIRHRAETRGVGGIFFDRLHEDETHTKEQLFDFVKGVGNTFAPLYTHFMRKNTQIPYGDAEKEWQLIRRSRYAEFNLAYDSGTRFGFETNGRTESILMSMPPLARWEYNRQTRAGSPEAYTLSRLKKGLDWV